MAIDFQFTKEDTVKNLPEGLKEYVPRYIENRLNDLSEIQAGIQNKEAQRVSDACHRINGTASNYGFLRLEEISRPLQTAVKSSDFDQAYEYYQLMVTYMQEQKEKYCA
jgi:HPt (histidine-containing phosphotransfer) domain-containing protein